MVQYMLGAVYNHYLGKQVDLPSETLSRTKEAWKSKSLVGKVLSALNLFTNVEQKARAARDILAVREDLQGEVAQRISWKLDDYRAERA